MSGRTHPLDHLVYATPHLERTIADLEARLGVPAREGGRHLGRGTRNALFSLGPGAYLEVLAPDPEQPAARSTWFDLDALTEPRLVAWAARVEGLEQVAADFERRGAHVGPVQQGGRIRPDGVDLRWRYTDPGRRLAEGLAPFFIDWGSSPHPSIGPGESCTLVAFRAEHPEPSGIRPVLASLDVSLEVAWGPQPALLAKLRGRGSDVELR